MGPRQAGSGEPPSRNVRSRLGLVAYLVVGMVFVATLTTTTYYGRLGKTPVRVPPGTSGPAVITVQNKYVHSDSGMTEFDWPPVFVTSRAERDCSAPTCQAVSGGLSSGAKLTAVCFVYGQDVTNMNARSPGAASNPERITSSLWYGVEVHDDRLGYFSEAWVVREDRGSHDLPACRETDNR
jgi:hypothetical protein